MRQPGLGGRGREGEGGFGRRNQTGEEGERRRRRRRTAGERTKRRRGREEKKKEGKKLSISYTLAPSPNKHPPSTTANTTTQTHAALL